MKKDCSLRKENGKSGLFPWFTFDNFVVESGNEQSHAACKAMVNSSGKTCNPLFLVSSPGLGKTHLVHAVAHKYIEGGYNQILYKTSEDLRNELVLAKLNQEDVIKKFQKCELLIIDDIHALYLQSWKKTRELFRGIINDLYRQETQIILTLDGSLEKSNYILKDLTKDFNDAGVFNINPPDLEARLAIVSVHAKRLGVNLDKEVSLLLASKFTDSVLELVGAIGIVKNMEKLSGEKIDVEFVSSIHPFKST